jgi:hypothetical protein
MRRRRCVADNHEDTNDTTLTMLRRNGRKAKNGCASDMYRFLSALVRIHSAFQKTHLPLLLKQLRRASSIASTSSYSVETLCQCRHLVFLDGVAIPSEEATFQALCHDSFAFLLSERQLRRQWRSSGSFRCTLGMMLHSKAGTSINNSTVLWEYRKEYIISKGLAESMQLHYSGFVPTEKLLGRNKTTQAVGYCAPEIQNKKQGNGQ